MEGTESQGRHDTALAWFTEFQLDCVIKNGVVPEWFHGIISRKAAEEMLLSKPPGYFLIRVSESRIGYTLSYRAEDRCRHFMIDPLKDNYYIIVGEDMPHRSLQDLVDFHRRAPIMPFNERLTVACGQVSKDKVDYAELLFTKRNPMNPITGLPPNNPLHTNNNTHLRPSEDTRPSLPQRPIIMRDSAVPAPNASKTPTATNSHPPRLYPCLETELPALSFHNSATVDVVKPVPLPRKIHLVKTVQADRPPELPARGPPLPQKRDQPSNAPDGPPASRVVSSERTLTRPNHSEDHIPNSNPKPNPNPNQQKNQDVKSAVINLTHLKNKFHKKRSTSQEHMYAEISAEAEQGQHRRQDLAALEAMNRDRDMDKDTENEYQELPGEQVNGVLSNTGVTLRSAANGFPPEYLQPPPFAPGY